MGIKRSYIKQIVPQRIPPILIKTASKIKNFLESFSSSVSWGKFPMVVKKLKNSVRELIISLENNKKLIGVKMFLFLKFKKTTHLKYFKKLY